AETIKTLIQYYQTILNKLVDQPNSLCSQMTLLTDVMYQKIVYDWNDTNAEYPSDITIHQLFEKQVKATPEHIAAVYQDRQITYDQLNKKANQLAGYIRKSYQKTTGKALSSDTLIALCLGRSIDTLVSILAVLKAGGAYVPIDSNYPDTRIRYILKDIATSLLLTQSVYLDRLNKLKSSQALEMIAVDEIDYGQESLDNLAPFSQASDLAYVIYTSGTTGQPKGVM
ncbi:AMP-binding protein, partial [Facilibium subflavum]|uniref:AMP-binding protein n=1 Tax=Facilibium subflavum TaxID=2219058 RepID=UPI0013C360EF